VLLNNFYSGRSQKFVVGEGEIKGPV